MGIRLLFLSLWTPRPLIRRELANVSDLTTTALKAIVAQYAPQEIGVYQNLKATGSIEDVRSNMAKVHADLVETLQATLGHDEAVKLSREALFSVGKKLGEETKIKLGVGDNPSDLARAARVLYRVLGISFRLKWIDSSNAQAIIERCALANQYSKLTCEVLSATDEGVINGLQPNVTMKFREYLTSGCKNCIADLHFNNGEI